MSEIASAIQLYREASDYVASAGLTEEVQWQRAASLMDFTESDLLRESAWVILCSGFREVIVRRAFGHISLCFCDWESARSIVEAHPACVLAAQASFNSASKIAAIAEVARRVHVAGFASVRRSILADPIQSLRQFPYIGPITACHLAKNLGLDVAKPDRHLIRISEALGFADPGELCELIARESGDPVRVVDLVIWRYMADNPAQRRVIRQKENRVQSANFERQAHEE
jgi:hypothetical protein